MFSPKFSYRRILIYKWLSNCVGVIDMFLVIGLRKVWCLPVLDLTFTWNYFELPKPKFNPVVRIPPNLGLLDTPDQKIAWSWGVKPKASRHSQRVASRHVQRVESCYSIVESILVAGFKEFGEGAFSACHVAFSLEFNVQCVEIEQQN